MFTDLLPLFNTFERNEHLMIIHKSALIVSHYKTGQLTKVISETHIARVVIQQSSPETDKSL